MRLPPHRSVLEATAEVPDDAGELPDDDAEIPRRMALPEAAALLRISSAASLGV